MNKQHQWEFWIDSGGTFTDIVAVVNKGRYRGGDGIIRHIRFLDEMAANIISSGHASW